MKKLIISAFCLIFGFGFSLSFAQDHKVAFTNVELILSYMPETAQIDKQLKTFQNKLEDKLKVKQQYIQQKYSEYADKEGLKTWANENERENAINEVQKLEGEIQTSMQQAEVDLATKRNELLAPLQQKLQKAIDEVATDKGYDYVLNNAVGSGVPTILVGEQLHDITKDIAVKLGIKLPE